MSMIEAHASLKASDRCPESSLFDARFGRASLE
jgi:hypothetical protein